MILIFLEIINKRYRRYRKEIEQMNTDGKAHEISNKDKPS